MVGRFATKLRTIRPICVWRAPESPTGAVQLNRKYQPLVTLSMPGRPALPTICLSEIVSFQPRPYWPAPRVRLTHYWGERDETLRVCLDQDAVGRQVHP